MEPPRSLAPILGRGSRPGSRPEQEAILVGVPDPEATVLGIEALTRATPDRPQVEEPDPFAAILTHPGFTARFDLVRKLGQGGMGAVFEAHDKQLARPVALKVTLGSDPADLARFRREGRMLARLSHPHILKVYSAEIIGQTPVLVLEILEGLTLMAELKRRPMPALSWTLGVMDMVLDGLSAAHAQGIVHRDLKPENILLLSDGGLRILDFGLGKRVEGIGLDASEKLTCSGILVGTPAYMSPEQCRGEVVDRRSDLYQVGVTIFEVLSGRPLFLGASPAALLFQHVSDDPPALATLRPDLPREIDRIVSKAVAKRPEDRFQDAESFRRALNGALSASPRVAPGPWRGEAIPCETMVAKLDGPRATTQSPRRVQETGGPSDRPGRKISDVANARRRSWAAALGAAVLTVFGVVFALVGTWRPGRGGQGTMTGTTPPGMDDAPRTHRSILVAASVRATPADSSTTDLRQEIVSQDGASMVLVPNGAFDMGSPDLADAPVHRVHVSTFYMDQHEVTNRLYRRFVEVTHHRKPAYWSVDRFNGADQPVVGVSWADAVAYCTWAGKRLPTEAEWEKAARGGLHRKLYPWGNEAPAERACFNSGLDFGGRPLAVKGFRANGYGLFDLAGNVSEWCLDWYAKEYYALSGAGDPLGPKMGTGRLARGGAWDVYYEEYLRCAYRYSNDPGECRDTIGFRCVKSP